MLCIICDGMTVGIPPSHPETKSPRPCAPATASASVIALCAIGIAPVGDAWERIYDEDVRAKRDPLADDSLFSRLYKKDKFHPSVLGTFLAACVFALMILPEGSPIPEWRGDPRLDDEESEAVARLVTISKDDEHRLRAAALAAVGKRIDDGWVPNWVSDGGKVEL